MEAAVTAEEKNRCNILSIRLLHLESHDVKRNQVVAYTKNICQTNKYRSRDSSVSIGTRPRAERPGFDSGNGKRFLSTPQHAGRLWDAS